MVEMCFTGMIYYWTGLSASNGLLVCMMWICIKPEVQSISQRSKLPMPDMADSAP